MKEISAKTASGCGLVVDYRLGLHFFPEACSILIAVSAAIAASRVASRKDETGETIEARNQKMRQRLLATYGFDFTDLSRCGLVVCTDLLGEA